MSNSPYAGLAASRYWRSGVVEQTPATVQGLYSKKFDIPQSARIATAGSCFAQHIARHMRSSGFNVLDAERCPPQMTPESAKPFGYQLFSARFANIYVVRQLLQLAKESFGKLEHPDIVWKKDGRYYDALRPSVEPHGLTTPEEVIAHRQIHLKRVRWMFKNTDLFIFTLGLTEAWVHKQHGTVYPTAPGTIAGDWDPDTVVFKNFGFADVYRDFVQFRAFLKRRNPNVKFLITVSPVPLTATAADEHVLAATIYSKSVLRAVAGELKNEFEDIDYFPSYEIIASHWSRGEFYGDNLRSIRDEGVEHVMRIFFSEHGKGVRGMQDTKSEGQAKPDVVAGEIDEDVVCEDALLEAFAR